ncbi:hypothetical protein K0B03_00095 [Patescibacteria group bacterium]|nr:hypothetical protein [Patescibacteria group bacterium]
MAGNKQSIKFTKEQFEDLSKMVYLGNWMANAHRDGSTEDLHIEKYEKIQDYIFSLAPKFGLEKYMDHEDSDGDKYYPSRFFEEETDINLLHDEYDENTFWQELPNRLGDRDFFEKFSKAEIEAMSDKERFIKRCRHSETYEDELSKNGIERLRILKKD